MASRLTRADALRQLLALPDDHPAMLRRGYHYVLPRDPSRNMDIIKRDLGTAYVTHRRQQYGADISKVISVRRLQLVRRRVL